MSSPRAWIGAVASTAVAAALLAPTVGPAGAVPAPAPSSPSVVGAQGVGDSLFPHQGNGGYDVSHYDLDIAWTAANTIAATATITATTRQSPLEQFSLDLEGLTVSAVTVDGAAATTSRVASGGKFKLVVTPATPVDGEFITKVTYSGTPVAHTDPDGSKEGWVATTAGLSGVTGAVALNEPVGAMTWFPNNNTPSDKATFTTKLTVPYSAALGTANRTAVSNGVLVGAPTVAGSTRSYTWDQPEQQATYLAFVGIGAYAVAESDVALTSGTTHEWSYRDSGIPDATAGFGTARGKLSAILKSIEGHYGPYPGAATGVVVDSVPSGVNYALETQDRPFFPSSIDESTLVHELAHQWFGNAVSPADWSDVWLNEGPATFIETQVSAALFGGSSTQDTYYSTWNSSTTASLWSEPSAGFTDPSILFDSQVYTRGAVALEALRSSLGDAVFDRVMRTWLETYGGRSAITEQFVGIAEQVSGRDLTDFFQTWVYRTTKPAAWPVAYELSLASAPSTGSTVEPGSTVSYTLTAQNSGKVPTGTSTVLVDVWELLDNGTLGPLPAGVTRTDDTLVWAVPNTAAGSTATTTITATVDHPTGDAFAVRARGHTLGADCGTCASTLTVNVPDLAAPAPVVGGTARVGETVTATTEGWTAGTTFSYQWLRGGSPIPGATSATYALVAADRDTAVSVRVGGSKAGYRHATRTSEPVAVGPGVLTSSPKPTITGDPHVGETLTAVFGDWDPGATLTHQWLLDGAPITGATGTTYVTGSSQAGSHLVVAVTGTRPGYLTVTRNSDAVKVLATDPSASPVPTVTGIPRVGETLIAVPGTWGGDATLTYQWNLDGSPVTGATETTFALRPEDLDKTVTVTVTGTRDSGVTTRTSEPSTVQLGVLEPATPHVSTMNPVVDHGIRAEPDGLPQGTTTSFQWFVEGVAVPEETQSLYVPRATELDKYLSVTMTASHPGYVTSNGTRYLSFPVAKATFDSVPPVEMVGTPRTGQRLTLRTAPSTDFLTYRWLIDGEFDIPGATGTSYVVQGAYVGRRISVRVNHSRPGYFSRAAQSDPVVVVAATQTLRPSPTIAGTAVVGHTLIARAGKHDYGVQVRYQWFIDGRPVKWASHNRFKLRSQDRGKIVRLGTTATKTGYRTVVKYSRTYRVR
jgi:hypothetical protein